MLETTLGYTVTLLLYLPLNIFIHECGHAFFVKLFDGKMRNIYVGIGDPLFKLGIITVNKYFFLFGLADFDPKSLKVQTKLSTFFIFIGGFLFNAITLTIVILAFNLYDPAHFLKGYYIGTTSLLMISAFIPVTYHHGYDSDGKVILDLFRK